MFDFMKVKKEWDGKKGRYSYSPTFFVTPRIKDLMIRSKDFYAIFDETTGLWATSDAEAIELIDNQVTQYAIKDAGDTMNDDNHGPIINLIKETDNRLIDKWHKFCQKDMRDNWVPLDQRLIFSNQDPKRSDYCSKTLNYPLVETPTPKYDRICDVLYSPEEREKWEWFIGCIIAGDARKIQKMLVFYGEPGTGKSTIISKVIAETLLKNKKADNEKDEDFSTKFEANLLVNRDNFGTDFLERDGVLAYDDDAELGLISCKTTLNKIISHESVRVNCKFKPPFMTKPNCLLIVGSNEPVQMGPNSGMNRRLIDIRPTGNKLSGDEYEDCIAGLQFEKSGIAWRCLQVYKKLGKHAYDKYIAEDMMNRTSPFHNFVVENANVLKDGISLVNAYKLYCNYAEECNFKNVLNRYRFRDTLKFYYREYDNMHFDDFIFEKAGLKPIVKEEVEEQPVKKEHWLKFNCTESLMDEMFKDCQAQLETDDKEHPLKYSWAKCPTKLSDIDTKLTHFVKVPLWLIVLDFDKKGPNGEKDLEANIEEASKFPATYAEISKSGGGVHLHYIYTGGDPTELKPDYGPNIEVKVFKGGSALRRKLTYCNDIPLAEIASGLPKKGVTKQVVDYEGLKNERMLKCMIARNLCREYHEHTKPSIDFINALFKEAYDKGFTYNCRDMYEDIMNMAKSSSNHAEYCKNLVRHMHFASKDIEEAEEKNEIIDIPNIPNDPDKPIIVLDCEIAPSYKQSCDIFEKTISDLQKELDSIQKEKKNEKKRQGLIDVIDYQLDQYELFKKVTPKDTPALFLINWKHKDDVPWTFTESGRVILGAKNIKPVYRKFNPTMKEVEDIFMNYNIISHNGKSYDNHMLWAASQGYTPEELFNLSMTIINGNPEESRRAKFPIANNMGYADTLDFPAAGNKKGLKKWEIEFGYSHVEWPYPWTWAVPKDRWKEFGDYCENDVISCEMVFDYLQDDWDARVMLAEISGLTPYDTTNRHTTEILTHGIADPQSQYVYTDLSKMTWEDGTLIFPGYEFNAAGIDPSRYDEGTKRVSMKSIYRGEDPGEGGHKVGYPGVYFKVDLFDVASMHPHSALKLGIFGPVITKRLYHLVEGRVCVKHIKEIGDKNYTEAIEHLNELKEGAADVLIRALNGLEGKELKRKCKSLANALKTAINSVYGLTAAKFNNKLRDPRNIDNIVAKYGALFMINLKHELWDRGVQVVHISTDSIKIAGCTPEIEQFIMDFGAKYGYTFEHEAHYERMCLVDNVNYIAYETQADGVDVEPFWTATGDKFKQPYVFKKCFTHEAIEFEDMCETIKSIKDGSLHLVFDEGPNEVDRFIGRVSEFCAMSQHGANLYSINIGKRECPAGTKGYMWLESSEVRDKHLEDFIEHGYYDEMVEDAKESIEQFYPFEKFVEVGYEAA